MNNAARHRRPGSFTWILAVGAVVAVLIGAVLMVRGAHSDAIPIPSDVPVLSADSGSNVTAPALPISPPLAAPPNGAQISPNPRAAWAGEVSIPSQDVTAPIVGACAVHSGTMVPPASVHQTCGWGGGAAPTDLSGAGVTVITGHVNYVGQGRGALGRIVDLHADDAIVTTAPGGARATWTVTSVVAYVKAAGIPAAVFTRSDGGHRTLRLVTCGGQLQADGNYDENIVVTAVLT